MARVTPDLWERLQHLEVAVPALQGITDSIRSTSIAWGTWADALNPIAADLPDSWGKHLTMFQRLLLIKAMPSPSAWASNFSLIVIGPGQVQCLT